MFAINPYAVSRYRDRHGASGKKSDAQDALTLANILRTDMAAHRPLPADSEPAQAITVLARTQQDAVWDRLQLGRRIRSLLHDYYAAALETFAHLRNGGVTEAEARVILTLAPTPARAAALTRAQLRAALKRAGRACHIEQDVERLRRIFGAEHMRLPDLVEQAMGRRLTALLRQLEAACAAEHDLAEAVQEAFAQHPDAEIISSFPGAGPGRCGEVADEPEDGGGEMLFGVRRVRGERGGLGWAVVRAARAWQRLRASGAGGSAK
nr:hypothetical protein GCM10010200_035660 [Actinomadura rugatobispora]